MKQFDAKLEEKCWNYISKINWKKNAKELLKTNDLFNKIVPESFRKTLERFVRIKHEELAVKYRDNWLETPGFNVSDDSWSDLRAEIIGRGKDFFNSITVDKIEEMANNSDYKESFIYIFQKY